MMRVLALATTGGSRLLGCLLNDGHAGGQVKSDGVGACGYLIVLAAHSDVGAIAAVEDLYIGVLGKGLDLALLLELALLLNENDALFQGHGHGVSACGKAHILLAKLHVGAEAAYVDHYGLALILAEGAG